MFILGRMPLEPESVMTALYWKKREGYKEKMVLTIVFIILSLVLFSPWTLGLHLLEKLAHL